jgi:cardiolipin synthase
MLFALLVAASRGVRVRIYTNGPASEAVILYQAQRSYYRELLAAGVDVYETTSDYNHTKVLVVDAASVLVGSANLDMRSAHWNFETSVLLPDSPILAQAVLATLEERHGGCKRIEAADLPTGTARRIWDGVCRLLSPVL